MITGVRKAKLIHIVIGQHAHKDSHRGRGRNSHCLLMLPALVAVIYTFPKSEAICDNISHAHSKTVGSTEELINTDT